MANQFFQLKNYKQNSGVARIFLHVCFWIVIAVFYYLLFSWNNEFRDITIIFSAGLFPIAIFVSYFFNYVLVPKYLWTKHYGRFLLFSFYTLAIVTWCSFLLVFYAFIYFLDKEAAVAPSVLHPELQIITQNFVVFLAISIKQVKHSFFAQQEKNELEKNQITIQLKLKEAELKLLKAQIQPHFLFNTLNNLYGLTLAKSEQAPNLVLRLSEMLDYILYKCDEKFVFLSEEIKNLWNYIEIEKIRYPDNLAIDFRAQDDVGGVKIAPLLLIPFIENAFKHGVSNNPGHSFIKMDVGTHKDGIYFSLCNSKSPIRLSGFEGIGLKNVKKRLELLYPGRFKLDISDKGKEFCVNLHIKTKTDV